MLSSRFFVTVSIATLLVAGQGVALANSEPDHGHTAPDNSHAATDHGANHPASPSHAEAPAAKQAATVTHQASQGTSGNRLEDNPDAIERIRKILQQGIPEKATVKVTVPAGPDHDVKAGHTQQTVAVNPAHLSTSTGHDLKKQTKSTAVQTRGAHASGPTHWDYEGPGGPAHWAELSKDYGTCDNGKFQSPIHITTNDAIELDLEPITFNYGQLSGTVKNNGHTIQVNVDSGNSIQVRGQTFQLVQFHFHHPAEERINNHTFPMVMHMVHKSESGQLAVIGVMIEPGQENQIINHLWSRLPFLEDQTNPLDSNAHDLNAILPMDRGYYTFTGSLTTPPCSENVLWMIMQKPITLSDGQIKTFSRLYPFNARPLQAVNKRLIQASKAQ